MHQAHEMGISAQDELRQEVIQTLVKAGWTELDAIAAIKEIAAPASRKLKEDQQARQVFNGLGYWAKDGSQVIIVDPTLCDLLKLPEPL
jgi:hypothetical protein